MALLLAVLAGAQLPLQPVQLLWINMTTAIFLGLMLAFEPAEAGLMSRRPRGSGGSLLSGGMLALQLALTYLPFMNVAFHSAPIGLDSWLRVLGAGAVIYAAVGLEKWIQTRRHGHGGSLTTPCRPQSPRGGLPIDFTQLAQIPCTW